MVCAPAASGSVRRYSPARAASVGGPTAARAGGRPSSTSTTSPTSTGAPSGRVGPEERPLHADRQRQPEGREDIDAYRVGPAHEERLARPQPREAVLEPPPRTQRGDRRAPRREIPQQLLRRDRPHHPRPPPKAPPEHQRSDHAHE